MSRTCGQHSLSGNHSWCKGETQTYDKFVFLPYANPPCCVGLLYSLLVLHVGLDVTLEWVRQCVLWVYSDIVGYLQCCLIHFASRCPNYHTKTAGDVLYSTNTTQYSKPNDVAPRGCQEISSMIGSKTHLCETQCMQILAVIDHF